MKKIQLLPLLFLSLGIVFSTSSNLNAQTMISLNCNDGTFTDSGGSGGNYSDFEHYQYTICPVVTGSKVTLTFTLVDIEWGFDTLHIYDGLVANYNTTRLTPYWGLQDATAVFTSTSSDGCLTAIFGSDSSWSQEGWSANISCSAPLPVELMSFTAAEQTRSVDLKWTTVSENNNKGFDIEHSSDGRNWEMLDFVSGRGNTAEKQEYSFTDKQPYKGYNYYRLKQMDYDGAFEYSDIVSVQFDKSNDGIKVIPNPVNQNSSLTVQLDTGMNGHLRIFNNLGQVIYQTETSFDIASYPFTLPAVAPGIYMITIEDGVNQFTQRLVIQ